MADSNKGVDDTGSAGQTIIGRIKQVLSELRLFAVNFVYRLNIFIQTS